MDLLALLRTTHHQSSHTYDFNAYEISNFEPRLRGQ